MSDFRLYLPEECGEDGYPRAWHESLKYLARERAGHRCERCGHPYECGKHRNGEWTPCDSQCKHPDESIFGSPPFGHWRILTVHHLDGNKANCEAWNLAALCQKCHLAIQGRVKMDQMFFAELIGVSVWFEPHLKGYLQARKKVAP